MDTITQSIINRAKNLKQIEVKRILEHTVRFDGVIPFDMRANEDCAWFKVWAVTEQEAEQIVDEWLDSHYEC
jgi:hypothetical protein